MRRFKGTGIRLGGRALPPRNKGKGLRLSKRFWSSFFQKAGRRRPFFLSGRFFTGHGGFDNIQADAVDHATDTLDFFCVFFVVGDETVEHGQGLVRFELFCDDVGQAGTPGADAAGHEGPAVLSAGKGGVFDAVLSALVLAARDAHLGFAGQLHAVVFFIQGHADGQGVLLGHGAEGGARAGLDTSHHLAHGLAGNHGQIVPGLGDVVFLEAHDGNAGGAGDFKGCGLVLFGDIGDLSECLRGDDPAGYVGNHGKGLFVSLANDGILLNCHERCPFSLKKNGV